MQKNVKNRLLTSQFLYDNFISFVLQMPEKFELSAKGSILPHVTLLAQKILLKSLHTGVILVV